MSRLAYYLSLASSIGSVPNHHFSEVRYVLLRDVLLSMRMKRNDSPTPIHYRYVVNAMVVYGNVVVGVLDGWVDTRLYVDCNNHMDSLDAVVVPVDHPQHTDVHLHKMSEAVRRIVVDVGAVVVAAVAVHASTWVGVSGVLVRFDVVNRNLSYGTIPESVVDHEVVVVVGDCTHRKIGYDMDGVVVHSYHANPYDHLVVEPKSLLY